MKLCLITGWPSAERGISLNSARSCFDHLYKSIYQITILYINPKLQRYQIPPDQLYSNTPLDFDYQLSVSGKVLDTQSRDTLLKQQDYVLPIIHGTYGEDGQIQSLFEDLGVPYLGSSSQVCSLTADKYQIQNVLRQHGYYTLWSSYIIRPWEDLPHLAPWKWVVKPLHGWSSIGVHIFDSVSDLQNNILSCFQHESECILEPYCDGQEFTILVLQNADNQAVALLPTQIVFHRDTLFDYRKKYLSTSDTAYYTPPTRSHTIIDTIRHQAQEVFGFFGLKDMVRLDGWLMADGQIWRSDINRMSGMEQNSFLFQQTSLLGRSHRDTIHYLIHKQMPPVIDHSHKTIIPVVFGGDTAERQVSILSGTNVIMKLLYSDIYYPKPIFMNSQGDLYEIPFQLCLLHSVEEIEEKIWLYADDLYLQMLTKHQIQICQQLWVSHQHNPWYQFYTPHTTSRSQIWSYSGFVFLWLHGGSGENGQIQSLLDTLWIRYNGPRTEVSALCADKIATKKMIDQAHIEWVTTAKFVGQPLETLNDDNAVNELRHQIQEAIGVWPYIIKPADDGCSAGVMRFETKEQLQKIISWYHSGQDRIPAGSIYLGHGTIMLPSQQVWHVLIEQYIVTDQVKLDKLQIERTQVTDRIEVTIGVVSINNTIEVLNPSQTIASWSVLSMEEKFMGGTGINLTPPPRHYLSAQVVGHIQQRIWKVANVLGITGYSRIDTFVHRLTGDCIIIEVNTLPALTPSTVLFHQWLTHFPARKPLDLIHHLIQ